MNSLGTSIVNGIYRIVINQILQSPGIYYRSELDHNGISVYTGTIISDWGGRSELEIDRKARIWARVSRKQKISILVLSSAMGLNLREILENVCYPEIFLSFLNDKERKKIGSKENSILEFYQQFACVGGDPVFSESLCKELQKKFFQQRCELGRIGRRNMNRKLNLDIPQNNTFLLPRDILAAADHLIGLKFGMGALDDMNHLKNKRIRSVADLLQDQFGLALVRLENVVRGTICGAIRHKLIPTPQNLVTSPPLTTTYESFFGLHPLSQVLDRTNPLTQIVHGRKLSYLGPGGLTGRTASFRIRDIHPSHYGRICPIDTSEGINVGLIGSLSIHARIGHWGSLESPFYEISERSTGVRMLYLSPGSDEYYMVAAGNSLALNRDIQEEQGQILADGAATVGGELALGKNVLVAYMPWEGYNSEDAVLISERLVYEDIYTSFHIRKYEIHTHVTSQGPEKVTNEIPHLEAHLLRNLDKKGIVMLGSWVETGDILVGKLTPQVVKESSYAPEDRLLRAILGIQVSTSKETCLKLPIGGRGRVIDVRWIQKRGGSSYNPETIRVYISQKREIKVGDKVAGRHGNKGIDDLLTIPSKGWLVQDAEQQSLILEKHHHYGNVHAVEKLRQSIEIWYATSEYLRQEMNPNFRMTDPFNPVHIMSFSGARGNASQVHQLVGMRGLMSDPQGQMIDLPIQSNLREGLSLTEYIISCYGARKGVVDTAVRTSDAGYLTRRLVEVVQHIVVRRTDCGTARGISVSPRNGIMPERIFSQTLIGRVLADDIYMGSRCIATRNQAIGIGLVNRFITFRAQPISIRTPFTCRSTSWICRLCYGRSPTHGDLVELGEAVGIIAGQSIGEPGTQLTLRTFHTGGVFTGGTAEHVRAPSNGKIKFNEDLVHPTRTRHGHPAFLCSIDLYVTIESEDILHNVNIPPKSLLLVQNDQYVESEQVIAEIRAGISTLNFKEKVRKHIYSDSDGEMHWSTDVYHAPEFTYGNVHLLPKTSHLWILLGGPCRSSLVYLSIHKDQDQMNAHSLSGKPRYTSNLSVTNDQARQKLFSSDFYGQKEDRIPDYSDLNRIICTGQYNLVYSPILHGNSDLLSKRRRNKFIIPLHSIQELENELMPCSGISIEIPVNGIFRRNSILAYFDDPRYRRKSSGIIKYGTIETHSVIKKEDLIEYRGVKEFRPKYQMKVDRFFFIPEEVHILPGSSSIMVRNNSIVGVDTQITLNLRSRVGGLVRVERKKKRIELKIFSGDIHFPGETDKISRHTGVLIPPGTGKRNSKEYKKVKNWIYVQRITPSKKRFFVLVRPVVTYEITDGINLGTLFPPDPLQERDNVQLRIVNYILYGNGKPIRGISDTSIQLVRTCLVLNWNQDKKSSSCEEARASFVEIRTNGLIRHFLRINLVKSPISYIGKRNDPSGSGLLSDNGSDCTNINPFSAIYSYSKAKIQQSLNQPQGTIHTLLNRNKECQSLIILSAANCSRMEPFKDKRGLRVGTNVYQEFLEFLGDS
ncbi:hypothetical protein RDI58_030584 [Solanum bulbocastanum]|uniref:DNA-directed RNA polymerase n=1 Tax=Solanum bulbocastanum TaxID=147425 RepID=A0AAN8SNH8_SOLBU